MERDPKPVTPGEEFGVKEMVEVIRNPVVIRSLKPAIPREEPNVNKTVEAVPW
jgi:hypothetical protein